MLKKCKIKNKKHKRHGQWYDCPQKKNIHKIPRDNTNNSTRYHKQFHEITQTIPRDNTDKSPEAYAEKMAEKNICFNFRDFHLLPEKL